MFEVYSAILAVVIISFQVPSANVEFILREETRNLNPTLYGITYSDVTCFLDICIQEESEETCPPRSEGYCPPLSINDLVIRDGQYSSLEETKRLLQRRIWWDWWNSLVVLVLFLTTIILLFYITRKVQHLDRKLMSVKELTELDLPYDGSFGFPLLLHGRMGTKLDFDDDFVDVWKKENIERAPITDVTGWHDASDTPSDVVLERRIKLKKKKLKKIRGDEEQGIHWRMRQPSAVRHPNFLDDNARLREYLRLRSRFKVEGKHMKRALLEHDIALARRVQAGMRLMAKHNQMALAKRLEELERRVAKLRKRKAKQHHRHNAELSSIATVTSPERSAESSSTIKH